MAYAAFNQFNSQFVTSGIIYKHKLIERNKYALHITTLLELINLHNFTDFVTVNQSCIRHDTVVSYVQNVFRPVWDGPSPSIKYVPPKHLNNSYI